MQKLRALLLSSLVTALPAAASAQSIETQQLRQLDAWSVSAISQSQGALPDTLWAESDPRTLAVGFDRLPANYNSAAAQELARRVLFSGGAAPRGEAADAGRKRFEALGRMGAADELSQMAAGAGASLNDPAIAQYAAQAELARGRRAEACARGRAGIAEQPAPFFLRLRAYCAAVTGDRAAADLALELARAQNAADNWYTGAVAAAGGAPGARPPAARYENALTTQLSLAGQLRPGPNPLNGASTLALAALARNEATQQPFRAQAAALAFVRGALPAAEARTILAATPAEVASALPALATALRQTTAAPGSIEAAGAVAELLRRASTPGELARFSGFFKEEIAGFATAPDAGAALIFARAAVATGDARLAQRLTQSARLAGVDIAAIAPLEAAIAVMTSPRGTNAALAVQRRIDAGGASQARAAARDAAIMSAMGLPLDGAAQAFLLANPPRGGERADSGLMLALADAGDRRAVGEVGLLAAAAGGEAGPARLDAESLTQLLRALRGAGLQEDARRIAVEALLAGAPS